MFSRVYVEITNICNMNCSFCHGHSRKPRRMTREEFSLVLDKLSEHTEYIYYHHLMGEPLTHPELPEFLKMSRNRGFRSIITTNGTLLAKRGDEIISSGLHKVSISLHSFEDGDDESYEKYIKEVSEFALKGAKAGVIVVFRLWNRGHDGGRNEKALDLLKSYLGGEWTETARSVKIKDKIYLEYGERFGWPDIDAPVQGKRFFCYGMRDHFGVLCDGSIVPCCLDSEGAVTLGNIFTDDLIDVLASERATAIVEGFDKGKASEELCRRCAYAQRFV